MMETALAQTERTNNAGEQQTAALRWRVPMGPEEFNYRRVERRKKASA